MKVRVVLHPQDSYHPKTGGAGGDVETREPPHPLLAGGEVAQTGGGTAPKPLQGLNGMSAQGPAAALLGACPRDTSTVCTPGPVHPCSRTAALSAAANTRPDTVRRPLLNGDAARPLSGRGFAGGGNAVRTGGPGAFTGRLGHAVPSEGHTERPPAAGRHVQEVPRAGESTDGQRGRERPPGAGVGAGG